MRKFTADLISSIPPRDKATPAIAFDLKSWAYTGARFLYRSDVGLQLPKIFLDGACRDALDFPIARNQRNTEWRKPRSAAVLASDLPIHGFAAANKIDLVEQMPSFCVRYMHRPPGRGNRAPGLHSLEQLYFVGNNSSVRRKIDAETQGR
jgi:hypothetical protein